MTSNTQISEIEHSSDVEMAGIRASVARIELPTHENDYMFLPPKPEPGEWIDITGASADLGYAVGVLDVPAVGTSVPFLFPSVRVGDGIFNWANSRLDEIEQGIYLNRVSLPVIEIDSVGYEADRFNFYEGWTASINLLNPVAQGGRETGSPSPTGSVVDGQCPMA